MDADKQRAANAVNTLLKSVKNCQGANENGVLLTRTLAGKNAVAFLSQFESEETAASTKAPNADHLVGKRVLLAISNLKHDFKGQRKDNAQCGVGAQQGSWYASRDSDIRGTISQLSNFKYDVATSLKSQR